MTFRLQGKPRYMPQGSIKSPALIVRGKRWSLLVPVTTKLTLPDKSRIDRVLAVDVGINTAATWAVVDATGIRWFHRQLVACIGSKATEAGLGFQRVVARDTSRQAFDGPGPVRRDASHASLCTFMTGKHYITATNIAARGLLTYRGRRKVSAQNPRLNYSNE